MRLVAKSVMLACIEATKTNGGHLYVDADAILLAAADFFVANPHLAQHFVDLAFANETLGEGLPLFACLFEDSASATASGGTEDYRFGYRLRTAEQCEAAIRAWAADKVALGVHG
jgi:hypothetical protein